MNGYKIIDFKGEDVSAEPTIDGIFNEIEKSNKPLIFTNMVCDGTVLVKPYFSSICTKISTGPTTYAYVINGPVASDGKQVLMFVNNNDSVTIPE